MTERDLENLGKLPVPAPREAAKRAAINAALAAFDASTTASALAADSPQFEALGVPEAPNQQSPQGNVVPLRQTETSPTKRSFLMRLYSRPTMALAASLTALMIAAPLAFRHVSGGFKPMSATVPAKTVETDGSRMRPAEPQITEARPESGAGEQSGQKLVLAEKETKSEVAAPPASNSVDSKIALSKNDKDGSAIAGRVNLGRQSQSSDNTALSVEPPIETPAPAAVARPAAPPARPTDGLGAVGGYVAASPEQQAANGPDLEANAYTRDLGPTLGSHFKMTGDAKIAQSGELNAAAGKRMLERGQSGLTAADPAKANPYAWMGHADAQRALVDQENRDKFEQKEVNPVKQVATEPVSTFSIDVDTASYSFVRRALNAGHLPPKESVRVEEMINYFPYAYPGPDSTEVPFKPTVTVVPSPWNANNQLVHVAIKGYDLKSTERPRANLVFLMDVSGSMEPDDRLPLVKNAFRMLIDQLKPDDTVAIVTYASGSGIALEPTKISDKAKILRAIGELGAGGSTAGAAGISDAYRLAESGFDKSAINRVILATDGDFNVGITDQTELKGFIERKRQSGIFLSILGVGQGNHNDALMQTLAQNGNGTAAYVDTLSEARKVLVDESSSTLFTIAKDVKVQIEWNPERVAEYRLIGYETRALKREDFNNDKIDAGDIGSGHTVTAIYEVTPVGAPVMADDLRYGKKTAAAQPVLRESDGANANAGELGFLKLRYKRPNEDASQLISLPVTASLGEQRIEAAPTEVRFSTAVAAFGQLVRGAPYMQEFSYDDVLVLAQPARGDDPFGYRAEFLNLVRLAKSAQP